MVNLTHKLEHINKKAAVFHLSGKILTKDDFEEVRKDINESIECKYLQFVLCLTELDYMNSTGLSFLISSFTKVKNNGGRLVICDISKKVKELITITKLNTIIGVYNSVDEAIQGFD